MDTRSLPIRVNDKVDYVSIASHLDPGDKIVMYTDGISEARSGDHMFGIEGIEKTLAYQAGATPDEMLDMLFCAASDASEGKLADDAAVIVVERR